LSGWLWSNLVAELEPEFSVPVAVEDDVNAAAFA
jgi:predicted NBD/HSP70 family sugar kinase